MKFVTLVACGIPVPRLPLCEDGRKAFGLESDQRMPLRRNIESAQNPMQKMNLQLCQDIEDDGQNLCDRRRIWKQLYQSAAGHYRLCLSHLRYFVGEGDQQRKAIPAYG